MSSQKSFQSILGKFSDGLDVLKQVPLFNPNKSELKLTFLETLKTTGGLKNSAVVNAETDLQKLRNSRRAMSFKVKGAEDNCIENRIKSIASYIKAEKSDKHPAYLKITSIIDKIHPPYEKKTPPAEGKEQKKSNSQSEKSFQSLVGFGNDVNTIITNLGAGYDPSNTNISAANFKAKVDELASLNSQIVTAENNYSTAVKERSEVYKGEAGINSIISSIKDYLASLDGGKKNPSYVAFCNAVK